MKLRLFRKEERKILEVYRETLKKIFKPERGKIVWDYKKVHNEEFKGSNSSAITVRTNI
jgi:hypothetical protein